MGRATEPRAIEPMESTTRDKPNVPARNGWWIRRASLVDREAFVSEDIYRLEIERIFNRTWIFLAHESEIPGPGDYVARILGRAPVVVVAARTAKFMRFSTAAGIAGPCMSCRCRQRPAFRMPLSGWSYERDGRLITTTFDRHLPKAIDFSELGLIPVTRLANYRGLIFGSWNPDVVDLPASRRYRLVSRRVFARTPGGMEVLRRRIVGGRRRTGKSALSTSSATASTSSPPISARSRLDPVRAARAGLTKVAEDSFQVATDDGHGCTVSYLAPGLPEEAYTPTPLPGAPLQADAPA